MKTVFIYGTAGSGKSLLASKLRDYWSGMGTFAAVLNLDPGAGDLPYECDVDVRDTVDIPSVMSKYGLGPNGALVMAGDLVAAGCGALREEVDSVNPDYLIVDTPGQVELFAYRSSGRFIADNLTSEERSALFLFDGALVTEPANFASIALLAASVRLRMGIAAIPALTKTDIVGERTAQILGWSENPGALEAAISGSADGETYALATSILRGLEGADLVHGLVPVSGVTGEGLEPLAGALGRILNLGEEVED
ncbi:MAG: ATP/GTP-binding protein [Nitrosopumilus sp.]|nr:ATP/GTP-binding protein [Nitrosopumilus sp.]CAI9830797.1 GTPase [Nitrosopumilaceae archaeon]MDA7941052.1 ATP/GTP-binding protein [Nitrosopumilus sp.]MDA7942550.1 ATP/GTP-binding protein [Nitrosopumilus sp.]MDA7944491.1 ATP/GTP-binding protein [Nitrosopumilus sp.]